MKIRHHESNQRVVLFGFVVNQLFRIEDYSKCHPNREMVIFSTQDRGENVGCDSFFPSRCCVPKANVASFSLTKLQPWHAHVQLQGCQKKSCGVSQLHFWLSCVACLSIILFFMGNYRAEKKSWYVVARNLFLLLLNFSAWPCLGAA